MYKGWFEMGAVAIKRQPFFKGLKVKKQVTIAKKVRE